jgi:hypothetical protein
LANIDCIRVWDAFASSAQAAAGTENTAEPESSLFLISWSAPSEFTMIKTLLTVAVLAIATAATFINSGRAVRADAVAKVPSELDRVQKLPPDIALPAPHEPFDLTPITPVESAGAPMYD